MNNTLPLNDASLFGDDGGSAYYATSEYSEIVRSDPEEDAESDFSDVDLTRVMKPGNLFKPEPPLANRVARLVSKRVRVLVSHDLPLLVKDWKAGDMPKIRWGSLSGYVCIRYQRGETCPTKCKYIHVCATCAGRGFGAEHIALFSHKLFV
ncbi:hypothetical protein BDR26DRAFT_867520 [Obelidium mucronatum]|nr:hypothetical protein BDR26DRAFT_867520 [Obelidium mucronatum]